nr:glycosyltransferase family 1 protein [Oecophyllibacter saccharovorans]
MGRSGGTGVSTYARTLADGLAELGRKPGWLLDRLEPSTRYAKSPTVMRALAGCAPPLQRHASPGWLAREAETAGQVAVCADLYRLAHLHYRYYGRLLTLRVPNPPRVMHWTYPLPLRLAGSVNIVTIHDLIPLTHPQFCGISRNRFARLLQVLCREMDEVVTVSETVREEIARYLAHPARKTVNLSQGVGFSEAERFSFAAAPQIAPPGAFVFFGRVEGRKNIDRLLQAHALCGTRTPLVIIGPEGEDRPDCRPRGPSSQVIRLPWSARASVMRALSEARGLLFPTLAEGFGLPIIEAMALGTPVLTSRGGVTEEVSEGAALLVDPCDVAEIAEGIRQLDALAEQPQALARWQERGRRRAAGYGMEAHRRRLKQFYGRWVSFGPDHGA